MLTLCSMMIPAVFLSAKGILSLANKNDTDVGFKAYPGVSNSSYAPTLGTYISNRFPKDCQAFMDNRGNVGPWGRTILTEMEDPKNKACYTDHLPADLPSFCPNFVNMEPERRKLFWLWVFASMAKPESSCNPGEVTAENIGLFQLDPPGCKVAGMSVSNSDLLDPHVNSRCAVRRLCFELNNRSTIEADHSRNKSGTYWAALRGDSVHSSEENAPKSFRRLVKSYPDCVEGSTGFDSLPSPPEEDLSAPGAADKAQTQVPTTSEPLSDSPSIETSPLLLDPVEGN